MYHVKLRTGREKRKLRIRGKVFGTSDRPRVSVFRSNKKINVQLIDDEKQVTIDSSEKGSIKGKTKTEVAFEVGQDLAKKALGKKIDKVVFDRGGYKYHGRVKALAEGLRKGGLKL